MEQKANDLTLERELVKNFAKVHKWVKKDDAFGAYYKFVTTYSTQSTPMPQPDPPEPLGFTSSSAPIYKWNCQECEQETYSDDPALGECAGRPKEDPAYTWGQMLHTKMPNYSNLSQNLARYKYKPGMLVNTGTAWGFNPYVTQTTGGLINSFANQSSSGNLPVPTSTNTGWKIRLKNWMTHNPFVQKEKEQTNE